MAKRFTDSDKWKRPFIRCMKAPYKLLWLYILDECDHAGIWHVDLDVAEIKIGEKINLETALSFFEGKIFVFDNGEKWYIPDFIEFQYGVLNPENRAHNSVLKILERYNLTKIKPLTSPLQGAKDKYKDKDKDKEQDKDKETRQKEFAEKVKIFGGGYDSKMLKEFFDYWSESSEGGKKMRFELEKVFDIGKRLNTWANRSKNFNNGNSSKKDGLDELLNESITTLQSD